MNVRGAARLALILVLAWPSVAFQAEEPANDAAPAPVPAAKPAAPPAATMDPIGRTTPYGTVIGFLRAADKGDVELATRYLEGKHSANHAKELVRNLRVVLNRGLKVGLEDLSRAPEGRLDDGLSVYVEKVGTAVFGDESLDIVLRRTTKSDSPPIWLFSSETLLGVADAAEQLELGWGEALWSNSFRERTFLSYPLYLLINLALIIPPMLLIAWLLTRVLLNLLRPWILRFNADQREIALARVKWLVFLLVFSVLFRLVATMAVTVSGRIFFTSLGSVMMIVAVSWLLLRITKLATRWKIVELQRAGMPSSIAAVELTGWLLMCVCVVAGLFLILRTLGFEITAAVAGLGVGGIAIAFAAQKTLENLFGTVTIVTDKPIRVGDYCQAGNTEGGVESIGLRSTRIRTPDRALVTIPNGQLASMTIGNLTNRDKFLFRHNIRLRYDTTAEQLREVLTGIRKAMDAHPRLEQSTIRTRLTRFGDYALEVEAYAYVLTADPLAFLEIQEELLLKIIDIVEGSGTAVAVPPIRFSRRSA